MSFTVLAAAFVVLLAGFAASSNAQGFTYNGFRSANLSLDGIAELTNSGLLMLTNSTMGEPAHAFHPHPIKFKNSSNGEAFSFSTSFVFAIRSQLETSSTDGLAFVIAPTKVLPQGSSLGLLGLFNTSTNGSAANHIFAVEFDTVKNTGSNDIDNNHVAIDINSINSIMQEPAGYFPSDRNDGLFDGLKLASGNPMQVWVDYDGTKKQINVTLAPWEAAGKPTTPLLNLTYDLSQVLQETMYVGFSAATGPVVTNHYILGWSFGLQGEMDQQLDLSKLPRLPRAGPQRVSYFLTLGLPLICLSTIFAAIFSISYYLRRKKKFAEVLDDWEGEYGPHRFKYKDLYAATKGFRDTELLGAGGFGKVYRGVLPAASKLQIAVKRISHESRQGIREFVTEIVSIGRMSHRNLVPLLGYCRRKGELLLVYDYMPNGSLDRFLYHPQEFILSWAHRFRIIKGVASGLFYLHEGWEQVVVHRDIKASNVLLDEELNARLGDFGLAKLYDHGTDPKTTRVVGTVGYLAPEHYRTGRATTSTDVYAFGAFILEVVCGKRPVKPEAASSGDEVLLVECVFWCWNEGRILDVVDPNLLGDFVKEEAELLLKLGLICTNLEPMARPSMQKVMLHLDGSMALPELSSVGISANGGYGRGFEDRCQIKNAFSEFSVVEMSPLSGGR